MLQDAEAHEAALVETALAQERLRCGAWRTGALVRVPVAALVAVGCDARGAWEAGLAGTRLRASHPCTARFTSVYSCTD